MVAWTATRAARLLLSAFPRRRADSDLKPEKLQRPAACAPNFVLRYCSGSQASSTAYTQLDYRDSLITGMKSQITTAVRACSSSCQCIRTSMSLWQSSFLIFVAMQLMSAIESLDYGNLSNKDPICCLLELLRCPNESAGSGLNLCGLAARGRGALAGRNAGRRGGRHNLCHGWLLCYWSALCGCPSQFCRMHTTEPPVAKMDGAAVCSTLAFPPSGSRAPTSSSDAAAASEIVLRPSWRVPLVSLCILHGTVSYRVVSLSQERFWAVD